MAIISRKTIDEVFATAQVDEVISDFMTLKKKGANYEGLCPFHNEKTPSFKVNPVKGLYKCFGCGKAGGAIQFVMEHEGMTYPDAISYLAKKYGIPVIEDKSQKSEEYDEISRRKESLYAAIEFAQQFFKDNLQTEEGKIIGLSYLKERGFTTETIEKFGLGYAPKGFNTFCNLALKMGFKEDVLKDVGLLKTSDKGGHYDFFRERVMFPFHNVAGKTIAFGGRVLSSEQKPKYLNSPESLVYIKSNILYGIFQAKNAIKRTDSCILVEGYADVISMSQAGIENVVASSGTSLTLEQARLIARFTQNVIILYDGDSAGIKASLRGINILLEQGLNVRVVTLDEGEDPDSFARKHDFDTINAYLKDNTKDFIKFKAQLLYQDAGEDPIRKAEANAEIIRSIAIVPDPLKRAQFVQEFAKISGLHDDIIQAEVIKARNQEVGKELKDISEELAMLQKQVPHIQQGKIQLSTEFKEEGVAQMLIKYGALPYKDTKTVAEFIIEQLEKDEFPFQIPKYKSIYDYVLDCIETGEAFNFGELMHKSTPDLSGFIADSMQDRYTLSVKWAEEEIYVPKEDEKYKLAAFESAMHLKIMRLKILSQQCLESMKETDDADDKRLIVQQIIELNRLRDTFGSILKIAVL
ncbi:MAG: DNA primase [Bacteroidia bacterium]|nr:DNA primase [Bacteroidia bacterium]MCO5254432.1 DNA primase [Bacteroidota bacterium]MCZ2129992.1 DNA primase [Bacteroidia bacterium]